MMEVEGNRTNLTSQHPWQTVHNNTSDSTLYVNHTSTKSLPALTYVYVWVTVAYVIVFIVGITGNALVLAVVGRVRDLRTPTYLFLAHLSVADLLLLLICMPSSLLELHAKDVWLLGETMCKLVPFLENVVKTTTVLILLTISFERYYAICWPLQTLYLCTWRRAWGLLTLVWVLGVATPLPFFFMSHLVDASFYDGRPVQVCSTAIDVPWKRAYVISTELLFFVIPLFVLMSLYAIIGRKLYQRRSHGVSQPERSNGKSNGESNSKWQRVPQRTSEEISRGISSEMSSGISQGVRSIPRDIPAHSTSLGISRGISPEISSGISQGVRGIPRDSPAHCTFLRISRGISPEISSGISQGVRDIPAHGVSLGIPRGQPHHRDSHAVRILKTRHQRNRQQVIYLLLVVIAVFFICLTPIRVFLFWYIFSSLQHKQDLGLEAYLNLSSFSKVLFYINSAANPVIYNIISSRFRQGCRDLLHSHARVPIATNIMTSRSSEKPLVSMQQLK